MDWIDIINNNFHLIRCVEDEYIEVQTLGQQYPEQVFVQKKIWYEIVDDFGNNIYNLTQLEAKEMLWECICEI